MKLLQDLLRARGEEGAQKNSLIVGWREWVSLPALGEPSIKAKIDTGARTSALHAHDLEIVETDGRVIAKFAIRPTKGSGETVVVEAEVIEQRLIRSSNGMDELRPVIMTDLQMGDSTWSVEITLADRELMGFPMLIGRSALRNRCLIDPNRSFCTGSAPAKAPLSNSTRKQVTE